MSFCWALLAVWPYLALAGNVLLIRVALAAWLGGLLATLVVTGVSIRHALQLGDDDRLPWLGMLVKLLHIPAYLIALALAMMLIAAPPLLLAVLLLDVCMLAATSAYTLRGVYLAWRGGKLSAGWALTLAISQCIFVLDVPGSIILHAIEKRRSR